jgi:uncharacterized protein YjeT (DUF2065 family)
MPSFTLLLLMALSLVFVIEGLIYALFPDALKRFMAIATSLPAQQFRIFGLLMALTGVTFLYFLKIFAAR